MSLFLLMVVALVLGYHEVYSISTGRVQVQVQIDISEIDSNNVRILSSNEFLSSALSSILAIEHFNTGNDSIVPIISSTKQQNCSGLLADVEYFDTVASPVVAVSSFVDSIVRNKRPDLVIGALRSAVTEPLSVTVNVQNIPMISGSSTARSLSNKNSFPQFARSIPPDSTVANALCILFRDFQFKRVGILHVNDAYGSGYKESLQFSCFALGILVEANEIQTGSSAAIETAVTRMSSRGYNIIVAVLFGVDLSAVISAGEKAGLFGPEKLWFFSDSINPSDLLNLNIQQRSLLEGSLTSVAVSGDEESSPGFNALNEIWPRLGENATLLQFFNSLLPGGSKSLDLSFTHQIPGNFFSTIAPSPSVFSRFFYDATIAGLLGACNSNLAFPQDRTKVNRSVHFNQILNLEFSGASGNVAFNTLGDRIKGEIRLFNYRAQQNNIIEFVEVGKFTNISTWSVSPSIRFRDGTSNPPVDITPPFHNEALLSDGDKILGYAYFITTMCLILFFAFWVHYRRRSRVVVRSQKVFLMLFLFGNSISIAAVLPATVDTGNLVSPMCMITVWFYSIGVVLSTSAILAKSYRVMKIFNNVKLKKQVMSNRYLFSIVFALVGFDAILLIIWTGVDPLTYQRTIVSENEFGFPTQSFGKCVSTSPVIPILVFAYHLVLLIGSNYIAYSVRDAPSSFQEAKWLSISLLCTMQMFILGIPTLASVYDIPAARFYMVTALITINVVVQLCCIFLPKIKAYQEGDKDEFPLPSAALKAPIVAQPKSSKNQVQEQNQQAEGIISQKTNTPPQSEGAGRSSVLMPKSEIQATPASTSSGAVTKHDVALPKTTSFKTDLPENAAAASSSKVVSSPSSSPESPPSRRLEETISPSNEYSQAQKITAARLSLEIKPIPDSSTSPTTKSGGFSSLI